MKENRKRVLSLLLVLVMLAGLFPSSAFADDAVKVRLASNAPGAKVTVYEKNVNGEAYEVQCSGDGYYHILPGTYYYAAEADGYADLEMTAFTVTADAEQTVTVTMTAIEQPTDDRQTSVTNDIPQGTAAGNPAQGGDKSESTAKDTETEPKWKDTATVAMDKDEDKQDRLQIVVTGGKYPDTDPAPYKLLEQDVVLKEQYVSKLAEQLDNESSMTVQGIGRCLSLVAVENTEELKPVTLRQPDPKDPKDERPKVKLEVSGPWMDRFENPLFAAWSNDQFDLITAEADEEGVWSFEAAELSLLMIVELGEPQPRTVAVLHDGLSVEVSGVRKGAELTVTDAATEMLNAALAPQFPAEENADPEAPTFRVILGLELSATGLPEDGNVTVTFSGAALRGLGESAALYKIANGVAEEVDAELDTVRGTLTFETAGLGTYALAESLKPTPRPVNVTVNYVNEAGEEMLPSEVVVLSGAEEERTEILPAPEIEGYAAKEDTRSLTIPGWQTEPMTATLVYVPATTLTIYYVDALDQALAETEVRPLPILAEEQTITITAPEIEGYAADEATLTLTVPANQTEPFLHRVLYKPVSEEPTFTLTVGFVDERGRKLADPVTQELPVMPEARELALEAMEIPNFTVREDTLLLQIPAENDKAMYHRIRYNPKELTLESEEGVTLTLTGHALPEGVLIENVGMTVRPLSEEENAALAESAGVEVQQAVAYDITLIDSLTGLAFEPVSPVSVSIPVPETFSDQLAVYHVSEEAEEAEEVKDAAFEDGVAAFEAESFSTYAIFDMAVIRTEYITADGVSYTITVAYEPDAEIPDGSTLQVTELSPSGAQFADYMDKARDALYENPMVKLERARMFDITILSPEGKEVQPAAPVEVTIVLTEGLNLAEDETVHALHVGGNDQVTAVEAESNEAADEFVLTAEGFSVYIIVVGPIDDSYIQKSWENERFKFTVGYTEAAGIPDEAALQVRQILNDTDEYAGYEARAEEATGGFVDTRAMLDIGLYVNGQEIEPLTDVYLSIQLKDSNSFVPAEAYGIIHLDDAGGVDVSAPMAMDQERTISETISGFSTFIINSQGQIEWLDITTPTIDNDPDWISRGGNADNFNSNLPLGTCVIDGSLAISGATERNITCNWITNQNGATIHLSKSNAAGGGYETYNNGATVATFYYKDKVILSDGSRADLLMTLSDLERSGTANNTSFFSGTSLGCVSNATVGVTIKFQVVHKEDDGSMTPVPGYTLLFGAQDLDQPDKSVKTIYVVSQNAATVNGLQAKAVSNNYSTYYTEPMTDQDTPVQLVNSSNQPLYYDENDNWITTPTSRPVYAKYKVYCSYGRLSGVPAAGIVEEQATYYSANGNNKTAIVSMEPMTHSESIQIIDGRSSMVYVPDSNVIHYEECADSGVRMVGIKSDGSHGGDSGSARTGFFMLADSEGFTLRFTAGSSCGTTLVSSTGQVRVVSETGHGGTISTTDVDVQGNEKTYTATENNPQSLSVPKGKELTYTMTPEPFYHAKTIKITQNATEETTATLTFNVADMIWDAQGNATIQGYTFHKDGGTISYTFKNIQTNKWIRVEWEADPPTESVIITKQWDDSSNARGMRPDALEVHLKALDAAGNVVPITDGENPKTELVTGTDPNIGGSTSWSKVDNAWTYTFGVKEGLEKFSVYEIAPTDYTGDTSATNPKVFTDYDSVYDENDPTLEIARVYKVTINNTIQNGSLNFKKVDEYGQALEGAVFALYTDENCLYPAMVDGTAYTTTSGSDGMVAIGGLPVGPYYMKETSSGALYLPNTTLYKVTLHNDPSTSTIEVVTAGSNGAGTLTQDENGLYIIENKFVEYWIRLRKTNDSDVVLGLEGGVFDLYDTDPSTEGATPVKTGITSGTNGYVTIDPMLTGGTWYLVETQAPANTLLITTPIKVTIQNESVTAVRGDRTLTVTQGTGASSNVFTINIPDPRIDMNLVKELYSVNGTVISDSAAVSGVGVMEGDKLVYRISVVNMGEVALENVNLTDALTITARSDSSETKRTVAVNADGVDPTAFNIPIGGTVRFLSEEITVGEDDNLFYNVATAKVGDLEKTSAVTTKVKHVQLNKVLTSLVRDGVTVSNPTYLLDGDKNLIYTLTLYNDGTWSFPNNQDAVNVWDTMTHLDKDLQTWIVSQGQRGTGSNGLVAGGTWNRTYTDGNTINYTVADADIYVVNTAYVMNVPDKTPVTVETPVLTNVDVSKEWLNADGTEDPPDDATVIFTLYAGTAEKYSVELDGEVDTTVPTEAGGYESAPWTASFILLPKAEKAADDTVTVLEYTVKETTGYSGYTAQYPDGGTSATNGQTITNKQDTTTAEASKLWKNANGTTTAPTGATVVFTLYNGNDPVKDKDGNNVTVTLDGTDDTTVPTVTGGYEKPGWTAKFVNLPKYQPGTTTEIVYTVKETTTYPGYTPSTDGAVASGESITNTQEVTTAEASKLWKNANGTTTAPTGATVVFTLYNGNNPVTDKDGNNVTVTLDGTADTTVPTVTGGYEKPGWTAKFVNLPKFQPGTETEIVYTVKETTPYRGYTPSTDGAVASGESITNTQEVTTAEASKLWKNADGSTTAPTGATVVFTLYNGNNPVTDKDGNNVTVTLDGTADTTVPTVTGGYENPGWTAKFVSLPKYQPGTTTEIVYTVKETMTYPDYTPSTTGAVASGESITNTQDTYEVSFLKVGEVDKPAQGADPYAPLKDAIFTLYTDAGCTTKLMVVPEGGTEAKAVEATSGTDGEVTFPKVPVGTFYMQETFTPDVYWPNAAVYTVTVTKDGVTISTASDTTKTGKVVDPTATNPLYTIQNNLIRYDLDLLKLDYMEYHANPSVSIPLKGAEFTLYPESEIDTATGKPIENAQPYGNPVTTGDDGKASLTGIPCGTWYLVETKQPVDYQLLEDPIKLTVTKDGITTVPAAGTAPVEKQEIDTTDPYHITLTITNKRAYGDLEIIKHLPVYEDGESASFAFSVVGELTVGGVKKTVYSTTAMISLNSHGSKNTVLHNIPAGAEITVTELGGGSSHYTATATTATTKIVADKTVTVEFTNKYTPNDTGGHGVVNMFGYDGSGGWNWTKGDSTPADKPLPAAPPAGTNP